MTAIARVSAYIELLRKKPINQTHIHSFGSPDGDVTLTPQDIESILKDASRYQWIKNNVGKGQLSKRLEMEMRCWSLVHNNWVWLSEIKPKELDNLVDLSIEKQLGEQK